MPLEVERKYLHVDMVSLRESLSRCGAHCRGAHFESNWVFDTAGHELFESGRLLRLRSQEWPKTICHVLTVKLPVTESGQFKVRDERETPVADGAAMRDILQGLGFQVVARYEKVRESWLMEDVAVELDVLPFMEAAELEGLAAHIAAAQHRLGLDKAEISTKSYHQLHQDWLLQKHLPPQFSFVFAEAEKARWRRKLGLPE